MSRAIRTACLCVCGALVAFTSPSSSLLRSGPQEAVPSGGTLRVKGYDEDFLPKLDPARGEMVFITQQIFDGLVRLDGSLNVVPDLAEYWNISDGGRRYTFFLRKGVRFHDGRVLTAVDVKYSLERLLRREFRSPYAPFLAAKVVGGEEFNQGRSAEVSGFHVLDAGVFEIEWRKPDPSALSLLSMSFCRILPRDLVERQGQDFFFRPVGTGPFRFDYWMRSPRLDIVGARLVRNEAYHGRKARLAAIEYSPYFTLDHFRSRVIDVMPYSMSDLSGLGCRVVEGGGLNVTYLTMSCGNPPLDRPRVRRALAMTLDKEAFVTALASDAFILRTSHTVIPAKLPGFFPIINPDTPQPEQARRILEEEGYFHGKPFPEVTVYLPQAPRYPLTPLVRELILQFEAIGVSIRTRSYRDPEDLKGVRTPFFAVLEWNMAFPDPDNVIRPLFGAASALNRSVIGYSSPELEKLLAGAEFEPGRTKRVEMFREMELILRRDVPAVPLYTHEERLAVQPYVRGLQVPALGFMSLDLREVSIAR